MTVGSSPERLDNLQVLRAFAAINVVLYHALGAANHYDMAPIFQRF